MLLIHTSPRTILFTLPFYDFSTKSPVQKYNISRITFHPCLMAVTMSGSNGFHTIQVDASEQLRQRLNEPETAEALNDLLDNLPVVAFSVSAVDGFLRRSETIADNVATSLRDAKAAVPDGMGNAGEQLAVLLQALPQLTKLIKRLAALSESPEFNSLLDLLSSPQTLNGIATLLKNIELISFLVTSINGFLERGDTIADNVAAGVAELRKITPPEGLDLVTLTQALPQLVQILPQLVQVLPQLIDILPKLMPVLPQLVDVGLKLQPLLSSPEFDALMNSGVLSPKTVATVGQAGNTFVETLESNRRTPHKVGLWGLLSALNDPNMQQTLGLLVDFSRRFGGTVGKNR